MAREATIHRSPLAFCFLTPPQANFWTADLRPRSRTSGPFLNLECAKPNSLEEYSVFTEIAVEREVGERVVVCLVREGRTEQAFGCVLRVFEVCGARVKAKLCFLDAVC